MLLFGTKFKAQGSALTAQTLRCAACGHSGQFIEKSGRNFITLYFVLPIIPVSGVKKLVECPNCQAQFEVGDLQAALPSNPGPYGNP